MLFFLSRVDNHLHFFLSMYGWLDLILTNYPTTVNKVETLPPIADHDIVYIECITANQNQEKYLNTPKQIGKI